MDKVVGKMLDNFDLTLLILAIALGLVSGGAFTIAKAVSDAYEGAAQIAGFDAIMLLASGGVGLVAGLFSALLFLFACVVRATK